MKRAITCSIFFLCVTGVLLAQPADSSLNEKNFIHYTKQNGLSNNFISGIVQDRTGYIWIATSHGLNRFDGINFRQFLRNSEHNPIPDNDIFSMQQLPGDEMAIATTDGAQIISTTTLQTKTLVVPSPDALHYWSNSSLYVQADDDHNYGVSTRTGFYIFSSDGKLKNRYDKYTEKDIGHAWMIFGNHIFKLPDGNLLEENRGGVFLYDRKKNSIDDASHSLPGLQKITQSNQQRPRFFLVATNKMLVPDPQKNSFDLLDIRNGNTQSSPAAFTVLGEINWQSKLTLLYDDAWAITSGNKGFYILKIDTITGKVSCDAKKYFDDRLCTLVYCDRNKRLWIGTDDGFFMEDLTPPIISSFSIPSQLNNNIPNITSLLVTADKIFAGTDAKQVFVLDKKTHRLIKEIIFKKWPGRIDDIRSMLVVDPDTIWIASTADLLWLNTKNFSFGELPERKLYAWLDEFVRLYSDRKKNKWIVANLLNHIFHFDQNKKPEEISDRTDALFRVYVTNSLAEDKNGNIWFGGDAIARWNYNTKKIDTLIERLPSQQNRKRGYFVMSDDSGNIWTTVNDDGIAKLSGVKSIHVRPENLLTDHSLDLLPALFNDRIFLATNNSLGFLDLHNLKSTIFDQQDGMPQAAITSHYLAYDSADKSTWFACKNLICKISSAADVNIVSPILKISDISIANDSFINYPPEILSLKYFQNNIRIALNTIDFTHSQDMRFAYRIVNQRDTNWIETGEQPMILLTNLPPGDYKTEIKLYSYNNKWPAQTTAIDIIIEPPFWKTWWFFSLIMILFLAGLYFLYKRRIKKIREKANIDKQLTEYEMKALHAQMNPHFIFNCLNSIREMILNNENREASHYLSKFAQLIRMTLNQSSKPFISLQQTIDYLERYLEMEQIRNHEFSYKIEVDEALQPGEIMIPPMLIQPFLENAIWHGVSPGKELRLTLRFLKQDQKLVCIVDDNGIGINASLQNKKEVSHNSIGIGNVKERIQVLNEKYNLQSNITIEDKSNLLPANGTGTIVKLYFPLKATEI